MSNNNNSIERKLCCHARYWFSKMIILHCSPQTILEKSQTEVKFENSTYEVYFGKLSKIGQHRLEKTIEEYL